jgi:hypothetical protein
MGSLTDDSGGVASIPMPHEVRERCRGLVEKRTEVVFRHGEFSRLSLGRNGRHDGCNVTLMPRGIAYVPH